MRAGELPKKDTGVEAWAVTKQELNVTKMDGFLDLVLHPAPKSVLFQGITLLIYPQPWVLLRVELCFLCSIEAQ